MQVDSSSTPSGATITDETPPKLLCGSHKRPPLMRTVAADDERTVAAATAAAAAAAAGATRKGWCTATGLLLIALCTQNGRVCTHRALTIHASQHATADR